ncbi:MAG TPA: 1-deoxy-D-xylulose-5-phosphate reductoisomerase [Sphingobacteriaceae bacterium]|nr:1-deoxy-D-xylulose-5-phosphate reductoisomerase [Sphingobacteriaceae bacterium]
MDKKKLVILGATGSIGTQTLEVIESHSHRFEIYALTAQSNVKLLAQQALKFQPKVVVIGDESKYQELRSALEGSGVKVMAGASSLIEVVQYPGVDMVLTALVGAAGLEPTIAAIEAGKDIALANKETLVIAGDLVMDLAQRHHVQILPVDSEHSAIFQCLCGENRQKLEKIYLTASGGPFFGWDREALREVSVAKALKHPNWNMGAKITIDSASLMNKGLEVIEAKWLFGVSTSQIEVVVHPQSIIHSMVQFDDGSIIAQMGLPDMKLPIQYALAFPERLENNFKRLNFADYSNLTFAVPDRQTFRNLELAFIASQKSGNMPCILNAANEVAVAAFLEERIGFLEMSDIIEETMGRVAFEEELDLELCLESDRESRRVAKELIEKIK